MKLVGGFILAVLVTYFFGTMFISQGNLAAVSAMGFEITRLHRLEVFLHDLTHMHQMFLFLVAISLLVALPVAGAIVRVLPELRLVGYVLAGFVGMIALHLIMKATLGLTGIAPTRELLGLVAQGVAGGLGGFAWHWCTKGNRPGNPEPGDSGSGGIDESSDVGAGQAVEKSE